MKYIINNLNVAGYISSLGIQADIIRNYEIKGEKIIVHYISKSQIRKPYKIYDYNDRVLDIIKNTMDDQIASFLEAEPYIIDEYDRFDKKTNSLKEAIFGDIKGNLDNVKRVKELEEMKKYLYLCKRYYENREELGRELNSEPVITANNFDHYTEQQLLLIVHNKKTKRK